MKIGVNFELRDGEIMEIKPSIDDMPYVVGLFSVPPIGGTMEKVEGTTDAAEPVVVAGAFRRGDKWVWLSFSHGTKRRISEWLHELGAERGKWYGCRFLVPT